MHCGCEPYLFKAVLFSVNGYFSILRLEFSEQTLNGDRSIVNLFSGLFGSYPVALLTAIAVYSISYTVNEFIGLSLNLYLGKTCEIFFDGNRSLLAKKSDVMRKIVSASACKVKNITLDLLTVGLVDKSVERTVSAANDKRVLCAHFIDNTAVSFCHIAKDVFNLNGLKELFYRLLASPVVSERIV